MKFSNKSDCLLPLAAGLGALGGGMRWLLRFAALDDRGLLTRGHPLIWAVLLVLGLSFLRIALGVLGRKGSNRYEDNFAPSLPGALGCLAAAGGCVVTVLSTGTNDIATLVWKLLGIVSVGLLLIWAWYRCEGKPVPTVCPLGVCLFFLAHLVTNYRSWSADPQTMDYLFDLLAAISLMLFSYYCAAISAGLGKYRMQLFTGLMAVSLCLMALVDTDWLWLHLGGLCLAGGNLCHFTADTKEAPHEDS